MKEIKKFNEFNESIKSLLIGPTKEEIMNNLLKLSPIDMFWKSVKNGILDGLKKSIELGVNIHIDNDRTIRIASFQEHYDIVKLLLENECDPNKCAGNSDVCALWGAVTKERIDIIKLLLDYGITDKNIKRCIKTAIGNSSYDIKKLLEQYLKNDINESIKQLLVGPTEEEFLNNLKDEKQQDQIIRSNIYGKIPYNIKFLIDNGMSIDTLNKNLFVACFIGNYNKVKEMLENGANPNDINNNCQSLESTLRSNNLELLKLLLENGANPNSYNGDVLYDTIINRKFEFAKLLIKYGADIKKINLKKLIEECPKHYKFDIWKFLGLYNIRKV